jgi:hypothetical protein
MLSPARSRIDGFLTKQLDASCRMKSIKSCGHWSVVSWLTDRWLPMFPHVEMALYAALSDDLGISRKKCRA